MLIFILGILSFSNIALDRKIVSIFKKEQNIFETRVGLPKANNKKFIPFKFINAEEFKISAKSGAILDYESNSLLFDNNANQTMCIASITKLMTALIFLDYNPGWDHIYEIQKQDNREGGKAYLFLGEKVAIKHLFYLSLVGSDNVATVALVNSTGLSEKEFVDKMNKKVIDLGLRNTYFMDTTGLSDHNISTAHDVAIFTKKALLNQDIRQAVLTKQYEFNIAGNRKKHVNSTDYLLEHFSNNKIKITGGKTGYTEAAGYCFVGEFINKNGNKIISVILGSENNNSRFTQTKDLVEWTYSSFRFK